MLRSLVCLGAAALLTLAGRPTPPPPLSPLSPAWKTLLGEFVTPPLAVDARRVYVATRDGAVRALSATTGEVLWKVDGLPGSLSASEGSLLLRAPDGRLTSLQPRSGAVRWSVETGVAGSLPAVLDEDSAFVAGGGLAAIALADGRPLWLERGPEVSAPPLAAEGRLLVGEQDGTLRARDAATGASLWTLQTTRPLLAPPLLDAPASLHGVLPERRQLYLATTDRRILAARLVNGRTNWSWTIGAAVAHPGLRLPSRIVFAAHDAVLYALRPGGNLDWRAPLPSRPLSGPLLVSGHLLVACIENQLVDFLPETGERAGVTTTSAEIRSAPVVVLSHVVLALRDRSLIAYALPGAAVPASSPAPPSPTAPTSDLAGPSRGR